MKVEILQTRTVRKGTRQAHGTHVRFLIKHECSYYWVDTLDGIILNVTCRTYDVSVEEIDKICDDYHNHRSTDNHTKHIVGKEKTGINLPIDLWTHLVVEHNVRPLMKIKKGDKDNHDMYMRIDGTKCYKDESGYHDVGALVEPGKIDKIGPLYVSSVDPATGIVITHGRTGFAVPTDKDNIYQMYGEPKSGTSTAVSRIEGDIKVSDGLVIPVEQLPSGGKMYGFNEIIVKPKDKTE